MDVDMAVLADGATQRADGKFDLFGAAFDTIFAPAVPALHPQMSLVLRILLTRHEAMNPHRVEIFVLAADGVEIARAVGELAPPSDEALDQIPAGQRIGVGAVWIFANLLFPSYGPYHFAIHWDGNEARPPVPLYVRQPPNAPAA